MRNNRSTVPECTIVNLPSPRAQTSVLVAALAAAGFLTLTPAEAFVFTDTATEPSNDAIGTDIAATVGTTYTGCVGALDTVGQPSCAHSSNGTLGSDPADFYTWAGLVVSAPYTLSIAEFSINPGGSDLTFDLFADAAALTKIGTTSGLGPLAAFVGNVPATGTLALEVSKRLQQPGSLAEGYTARLQTSQSQSVPEPATAALLAAGLVGAFMARRRKRS